MSEKQILRKEIKRKVNLLTEEQRYYQSSIVFRRIEDSPIFQQARVVFSFWSLSGEIPTHSFNERWFQEKKIILPVVVGDDLELRQYQGFDQMRKGAFNILEPVGERLSDMSEIDFAIIPGLAFTIEGHRLGRGRGFYDRLLPQLSCRKIGVCFDCQIVESLPLDPWDVPLDGLVAAVDGVQSGI